jgi:ABC-type multidrug transport system fused ATPase/permease subunit
MSGNLNTNREAQEFQQNSIRDLTAEYENLPHMGFVETLRILARSWSFVRFFKWRFLIKWSLTLLSLMFPILVLPWTLQIMIDHVVLGYPIYENSGYLGFPSYMHPILDLMKDMSPLEILIWLTGTSFLLVIFFGAYSNEQRDTSEADMQQGNDTATQQDNWTHGGFSFSGGISGYYEYKMNSRLTQSINHLIRAKLFHRIQSLPITTLEDQRIGDAIYRVMYDSPSINQIFYEIINRPTLSTILFIVAMATMISAFPHVPEVIWCAAAIFPIYILITGPFSSAMRRVQERSRHSGSVTTSTIEEGMDNILAVQSLGGDDKERERFGEDSKESFKRFRFTVFVEILLANAQGLGGVLILTLAFWLVISRVIEGELTPGNYGSLMFFFGWMAGPAISFATLWIHLQRFAPGMRRVFALMDLPVEEDLGDLTIDTVEGSIEVKSAGLVYPDGRRALKDVSFEAKIGQIVAFVGPTGSGKTSLAYLLPRYHMATEGEVFIDGINVLDIKIESLRSQITYVFQETQLFSLSIFENICFGKPEATQAEVERVAKISGIHDFIVSLPEGYETKLGTTAISKLSVGQKQRIAIARGLLRDSKILILDEPTSALDPETEQYLVNALQEAAKDRLVIIIAHRLSTIAKADNIIFLEDGSILEQGPPEELMEIEGGHYRNYVRLQTDFPEEE